MDRKDYRRADWLDCSERVVADITLSSKVEFRMGKRGGVQARIIRISVLNGNVKSGIS